MRRLARLLDRPYGSADNHRNMLQPRFMSIPLQLVRCHSARYGVGNRSTTALRGFQPNQTAEVSHDRTETAGWVPFLGCSGLQVLADSLKRWQVTRHRAPLTFTSSVVPRPSWRIVVNFTICGQSASQSSRNAMTTEETATCWSQAAAHTQADDDGVAPVCAGGALVLSGCCGRGFGWLGGCAGRL
jgi:hypothetical protein